MTYVWRPRKGAPAHNAAGKGADTACGRPTDDDWMIGPDIPEGRAYCRRCAAMEGNTKARPS